MSIPVHVRVPDRRRARGEVHLSRPRVPRHVDDSGARSSPHDESSTSSTFLPSNSAPMALSFWRTERSRFLLSGHDERSAHVPVLDESFPVLDAEPRGERQGGGAAGFRDGDHHVDPVVRSLAQDLLRKPFSHAKARPVDRDPFQHRIRAGEVHVLEYARRSGRLFRALAHRQLPPPSRTQIASPAPRRAGTRTRRRSARRSPTPPCTPSRAARRASRGRGAGCRGGRGRRPVRTRTRGRRRRILPRNGDARPTPREISPPRRSEPIPRAWSSCANTLRSTSESESVFRWRRSMRTRSVRSSSALTRFRCGQARSRGGVDVEGLRLRRRRPARGRVAHVADPHRPPQGEHVAGVEHVPHHPVAAPPVKAAVLGRRDARRILPPVLQDDEGVVERLVDPLPGGNTRESAHRSLLGETRGDPGRQDASDLRGERLEPGSSTDSPHHGSLITSVKPASSTRAEDDDGPASGSEDHPEDPVRPAQPGHRRRGPRQDGP